MPIVQAKCENCGGVLAVDDGQKAAICPFCNTPYVVQDAINNYNITNNINVGAGAVVNIYSNQNSDFEIESGVLKKYKGAATDVVIPDNVVKIGEKAFESLEITSVKIPNSVTSIGNGAFYGCPSLTSVTIGNSVTSIGHRAFSGCTSLTSVTIGNSVTSIGNIAFCDCTSLTSITIPDSVTSIGASAFHGTAYYNNESNWENGVLYIGNRLIEAKEMINGNYDIKNNTTLIADSAFHGCKSLTGITIPNSVTSIGGWAFEDCTSLTSVTIPDSVASIGNQAFYGCTSLTSVTIGNSVTSIGGWAFCGCTSLTSITIPNSVISLGDNAFEKCPNLHINAPEEWKRKNCERLQNEQSESEKKTGGCYVATAVYGSYDCPEVWTLRRYRDYRLALTWYGKLFIMLYYAISPTLVKWFGETKWFKKMWKDKLDSMVERLQAEGYESTPYNDKY